MLLQLMMRHNLQGYIPCSMFVGAPELPLKLFIRTMSLLCVCVCVCACLCIYTHFCVTFLQLPIPDPTQNTGTYPAIRLLKRLVSYAAQFVGVIQIIVPSVFQTTRISFNSLFWVLFFMFKQIYAVMLKRQQPCPAVRVGKSGCDNITVCLLEHNGYTAYWASHKRHRPWGVSLYVQ
jgi:hypothetical protein